MPLDINESVIAVERLFTYNILGNVILSSIVLIIFLTYIGLKYRQDPVVYAVVFTIPMTIVLAKAGYLPRYLEGVLVIICAFLMGAAIWKFFRP